MEDNRHGLKNRAPFKTDQRFVTLSPIIDSYDGMQYAHNPAFAGDIPADNIGLCPEHEEVPDATFRAWPEKRSKR